MPAQAHAHARATARQGRSDAQYHDSLSIDDLRRNLEEKLARKKMHGSSNRLMQLCRVFQSEDPQINFEHFQHCLVCAGLACK